MDTTAPESLIEHFSKLEDPRVDRNKKHELIDVIVLCVCAVVSGAEGWSEPPRVSRRVNCLSQAAIADSRSWWS